MIHLTFMPLIPVWLLALAAGLAVIIGIYALLRRVPGSLARMLALLLLVFWLAGPRLSRPFFEPAPQDVLLVVDHSPSMALRNRLDSAEKAAARLQVEAHAIPGLTLHTVTVQGGDGHGTRLFDAIDQADLPPGRFSGAILLTDGMVHDAPSALPPLFQRDGRILPLHVLLTGKGEETDRRLRILQAPPYALVGKDATLRMVVDDLGAAGKQPVTLTLRQGDEPPRQIPAISGEPLELTVPVRHPGETLITLSAAPLAGEVSPRNNSAIVRINGVRDRLKVLLVSGTPNQGERVWRRLLKADPSVDLVHFTILRPPDKDDGTPLSDLALIPFPIKELFQDKIKQFDLIILDGFHNAGILPQDYLANIADYVREGGGLLLTAGPEFTEDGTLQDTPLADILPAHVPSNGVINERFVPKLTDSGQRHPVTAGLPQPWGPWYRGLASDSLHGTSLLTGPENQPLLVLDTVRKGRVALLLSDQLWLWSRGEGGGGPQAELLKRLSHWLMKEPELEENQLRASIRENSLHIERHSDSTRLTSPARVTAPDGTSHSVTLKPATNGVFTNTVPTNGQDGLWVVRQDGLTAVAAQATRNPIEDADLRATATILSPLARQTHGATLWLGENTATPQIRQVTSGNFAGSGWIGFPRQLVPVASSSRLTELCPSWLALFGTLAFLFIGWWREGRLRRR
ncbi:VWA domain-containing protein [Asaia spathodeae]|uniref:VWA domain-containing protein n=1 Tax=Asaia spathodeae TaxID=657016 RepID=UPI002FC2CD20